MKIIIKCASIGPHAWFIQTRSPRSGDRPRLDLRSINHANTDTWIANVHECCNHAPGTQILWLFGAWRGDNSRTPKDKMYTHYTVPNVLFVENRVALSSRTLLYYIILFGHRSEFLGVFLTVQWLLAKWIGILISTITRSYSR